MNPTLLTNQVKGKKIIVIVFGTRPEIIKLFVLYRLLKNSDEFYPVLFNTAQQKISGDILEHIGLTPDIVSEEIPNRSTSINELVGHLFNDFSSKFNANTEHTISDISGVIVQGDTTSAYCGAMWAFFNQIPVFHIEAGLRTFDHLNPFPEEFIRESISRASALNFCPTSISYDNLLREGIHSHKCYVVGNTINDAIITLMNEGKIKESAPEEDYVLSTLHRRENWHYVSNYARILKNVLDEEQYKNDVLHIMHPNPLVRDSFDTALKGKYPSKLKVVEPINDYFTMLGIVKNSHAILTDSGGLQEESLFFNVPCGILRKVTERPEVLGVNAKLLPFENRDVSIFLDEAQYYKESSVDKYNYTFGHGNTSELIYEALKNYYF